MSDVGGHYVPANSGMDSQISSRHCPHSSLLLVLYSVVQIKELRSVIIHFYIKNW